MHLAAVRNGWRTIRTLINLGAKIDLRDNEMKNILHAVVIHGGALENLLGDELTVSCLSSVQDLMVPDFIVSNSVTYAVISYI